MNKKLSQYLIPATVCLAAVVGIFIFLSDKPRPDYRIDKFDFSKITGLNNTDWNRHFKVFPVPHIILQNANTSVKKYVFSTADCGIVKHGYINSVELFIVFDSQGEIENVILGKNIETPKLIAQMHQNGFFQQWNGNGKLREVQYVSGATYSCKAVSAGVSALQELLKHETFFKQ